MHWFKLRPTFHWTLHENRATVLRRLKEEQAKRGTSKLFLMFGEYGELHLPESEHRLWSPHLSFSIVTEIVDGVSLADGAEIWDEASSVCTLYGQFAPRLEIWTTVWIVYLVCCFTVFFGAIIAYVQWQLAESLWGLWVTVGAFLAWGGLYAVAYVGQQWSADQMHQLAEQLEEILADANIGKEGALRQS